MNLYERAKAEREKLLAQLAAIEETIKLLEPVYGEDWQESVPEWALDFAELGLTDSIRMLLQMNQDKALSPIDVRDALLNAHYDFGSQPNPMAAIHTVLKRITKGGDPRYVRVEGEKGTLYKLDSDVPPLYKPGGHMLFKADQGPPPPPLLGHPAMGYRKPQEQGPPPPPPMQEPQGPPAAGGYVPSRYRKRETK